MRRIPRWLFWSVVVAVCLVIGGVTALAYLIYEESQWEGYTWPTLDQELARGAVTAADIEQITIMEWKYANRPLRLDFKTLPSHTVTSREAIEEFVSILTEHTEEEKHRNHARQEYEGMLRLDLRSGEFYYVQYQLWYDQNATFGKKELSVILNVSCRSTTVFSQWRDNENVLLAEWLREHDPWYSRWLW